MSPAAALALPPAHDPPAAARWVADHLASVLVGPPHPSPRFRGGQRAADARLALLDATGYARQRNEVWPAQRRGATGLSPYLRHGLIDLPTAWGTLGGASGADRSKLRDELLWQEYARHLYARLGPDTARGLRRELLGRPVSDRAPDEVWDPTMACLDVNVEELATDGYVVNQARMWLASHWAVRQGVDWRAGEDVFFRHLLDGSRAANRTGWQWTVGTGTGRAYGFSRQQVERRAPGLCTTCPHGAACPIQDWPADPPLAPTDEPPRLRQDPDPDATGGPRHPEIEAAAQTVWLTAESLGDADPALLAHPDLPVVFVFDLPLLARLRLAGTRLVFLTETLADLAERREVEVLFGDPVELLQGHRLAVTWAPVPGFARRAARLQPTAQHPWPWLVRPHGGSVASFSAWRRAAASSGVLPGNSP